MEETTTIKVTKKTRDRLLVLRKISPYSYFDKKESMDKLLSRWCDEKESIPVPGK